MSHASKMAGLCARWLAGRSDSQLSPWAMDSIQRGTLAYEYKGIRTAKNPFDLALYDLLIARLRPRTIIEVGTGNGGSALWLADHLAIHGIDGTVHSLDIKTHPPSANPQITFYCGDARQIERTFDDRWLAAQPRPLLVIDDGDHSRQSVRKMLEYFGPRMSAGEYLIIEDGSADDLGLAHKLGGGPLKAIREYLASPGPLFRVDRAYCDFYGRNTTGNADGYLCRI